MSEEEIHSVQLLVEMRLPSPLLVIVSATPVWASVQDSSGFRGAREGLTWFTWQTMCTDKKQLWTAVTTDISNIVYFIIVSHTKQQLA